MAVKWSDQHDKVAQVHVRTHHLCRSIDQMVDHLYNMYPDLDRNVIEVHVKMWEDYYKKAWTQRRYVRVAEFCASFWGCPPYGRVWTPASPTQTSVTATREVEECATCVSSELGVFIDIPPNTFSA
ncbi:hypothetical protein B0I73DRAFT_169114 [Yarrowia lipolytica]|nr:hypothetical protein BKA90DRAFT_166627 [Yarrowia lipolytica]KAJ8055311.1 hypothetical protein LXG23DRAFT_34967 [Yarrowia lipolytica]RDW39559.1 hypothetical protein B0I73DRAFT_169114 [Yarrowia lipolytica]